jgi:ubiquinone/menaquinone biosynthesis C-methylase UbiE
VLRNEEIYQNISAPYDLLISKEDYQKNIQAVIHELTNVEGRDVVDLGAGTGRLACMTAPEAKSVVAIDFSADMLRVAASKLEKLKSANWRTSVADLKSRLPLGDASIDVVLAGWSFCYLTSANVKDSKENLNHLMLELERITRPGSTTIIFETMGTGNEEPSPPCYLTSYFRLLEEEYKFNKKLIRTDFCFDSSEQAEELCREFFGDWVGNRILENKTPIVPSWTGVWWKKN